MALLLPLLSYSLMFLVIVVGANHAVLDPAAYWHDIFPHTRIPTAIAKRLPSVHADDKTATTVNVGKGGVHVNTGKGTTVGVGKGGVDVHTGKGTAVNVGKGGVGVAAGNSKSGKGTTVGVGKGGVDVRTGKGTSVNVGKGGVGVATTPKHKPVVVHVNPVGSPFDYRYAASDTQLNTDPAAALFFLRADLRPGNTFALQLADDDAVPATFIPRQTAEAIPFSTSELPSILSRFDIQPNSGEAEAMRSTLLECEAAPAAGEKKLCATSLESMAEFATASVAARDAVAVGTEGGGAGAGKRRPYKVRAVRRVAAAGGKGVVACHPEAYPYAVFLCHASTTTEVYEVELREEEVGAEMGVKAVAVCHTNTAGWNPKHVAFRALKVRPGKVAVCHFLPRDHVVWAAKV